MPMTNRLLAPVALVFLVALGARAARPELTIFVQDQARDIAQGRRILAGRWTTRGPEIGSSSYHLGPLHYYVVAAGLVARDNPVDCVGAVAILNALGVAGYALVFRRMFGWRLALAGAAILALHPLSVASARILWNPALILPTSCLFVSGVWRWAGERRPDGLALMLVGASLMVQAHLTAWVLLPLAFLGLWRRAPSSRRTAVIGGAVAAALTLPWLWTEPWSHLADADSLAREFHLYSLAAPHYQPEVRALSFLRALLPESNVPGALLCGGATWFGVVQASAVVFGVLVLVGLVRTALDLRRHPVRSSILLVAVLGLGAALPWMERYVPLYYLEVTVPARSLLAAIGALTLTRWLPRGLAWGALAGALAVMVVHGAAAMVRASGQDYYALATNYADLRKRHREPYFLVQAVTLRARRDVARALAERFGITGKPALLARGHGPWFDEFLYDNGFWLREARARPDRPPETHGISAPIFISHEEDRHPLPGQAQRLESVRVGPFTVTQLRSAIDPSSWEVHPPDLAPGGRGLRLGSDFPIRPPRRARGHALVFQATLRTPERWHGSLSLQAVAHFGVTVDRVSLDDVPAGCAGVLQRGEMMLKWYRLPTVTPGNHTIRVHVTLADDEHNRFALDVYDIWS
ncbi:MAG: glycosyltransferase family 39 protein [Planctomycetes bacterium]|nr:glycosyltransferase family 39 protein [Planctomycetota bacterium]